MRIGIHTLGTRGDIQPYLALALALKSAGHEPYLAIPEQFSGFVQARGIACQPLPGELMALIDTPEAKKAMAGGGGFTAGLKLMGRIRPAMTRLLDAEWQVASSLRPEVIIYHPKSLAALHIAEKLSVPAMLASPLPGFTPTAAFPSPLIATRSLGPFNRMSHGFAVWGAEALFRKQVGRWRETTLDLSARPVRRAPDATLYAYSPTVLPRPADWGADVAVTGYWFLDGGPDWSPGAELEAFLRNGPPPVYVGFGSIPTLDPQRTTALIVDALQRAGQRGLLISGGGGLSLGALPEGMLAIDGAPHDWLFPKVAAVVHHGGAGTTAAGLRAGRPTIICPFFGDQPFWGRRVAEIGAGPPPIPQKRLTAEALAKGIMTATSDAAMARRAGEIGAAITAETGTANAVAFIEARVAAGVAGR